MPEVSNNYVRIPVAQDTPEDDIRTITLSADKGIKALYSVDRKLILTYLFESDKWNEAEANSWISAHRNMAKRNEYHSVLCKEQEEDCILVQGVVYNPWERDSQGQFISDVKVRQMAEDYMEKSRKLDAFHNMHARKGIIPVESYITPIAIPEMGADEGAWIMSCRIYDKEMQKAIRDGEICAYSVYGQTGGAADINDPTGPIVAQEILNPEVRLVSLVRRGANGKRLVILKSEETNDIAQEGFVTDEQMSKEEIGAFDRLWQKLKSRYDGKPIEPVVEPGNDMQKAGDGENKEISEMAEKEILDGISELSKAVTAANAAQQEMLKQQGAILALMQNSAEKPEAPAVSPEVEMLKSQLADNQKRLTQLSNTFFPGGIPDGIEKSQEEMLKADTEMPFTAVLGCY